MSYETRRSGVFMPILIGALVGNLVSGAIRGATDDTDIRIKGVQINNEQLYGQLSHGHEVGRLVLNDGPQTFTFQSRAQDGMPETCAGKYVVEANVAHVTGNLACTETVTVAHSS